MDIKGITEEISKVILGKEQVVSYSLVCFLSGGHLLLEDIPGVGKTTLALALSKALGLSFSRIQFTSDLMPSDITGVSVYDPQSRKFVFKEGPIFNNVVLADEINRATPKTQSALLEAMAEGRVSVDGMTYGLPEPFFVIATQNPVEQYGTFPLPESQRDRFTMRLSLGYPNAEVERSILMGENPQERVTEIKTLSRREEIIEAQRDIKKVFISPNVAEFVVEIGNRTRFHKDILLGVSTRGLIHTINASKALAYVKGRDFVVPEDVLEIAPYTLAHRIVFREDTDSETVIREILQEVPVPR